MMHPMKLLLLILATSVAFANIDHLPEDRVYTAADSGYKLNYQTKSILRSGKYALTFDDGPHITRTPIILDALKKYNAKATFFIITERLNDQTYPIFKRMLDEGHIVASHGDVHHNSNTISSKKFKQNIITSFTKLNYYMKKAGYSFDKFYYRFPYAAYGKASTYHHINSLKEVSQSLFGKNCLHFAFWDIDSGDWISNMKPEHLLSNMKANEFGGYEYTYKTVNGQIKIVKKEITHPKQGGVLIFHDIQERTVVMMDKILKFYQDNNLDIIPLDTIEEFAPVEGCKLKI